MNRSLAQSSFHIGRRCARRLWLEDREGSRRSGHPAAPSKRREVLEAAAAGFPGARTAVRASWGQVAVTLDLLVEEERGHRLIKVHAGTRPRTRHWEDLALQAWVVRGSGVTLSRVGILHLDRRHRLGQDGLPLFRWVERAVDDDPSVMRDALLSVLADPEPPPATLGVHCRAPRSCPWWDRCHAEVLPTDIRCVPGCASLADRLAQRGIRHVAELPGDLRLNALQKRAVRCILAESDEMDSDLAGKLPPLEGVHYLDFEAWNPAVPRFEGTEPYATLPVQWSLHSANGEHREWLHTERTDPRQPFLSSLTEALLAIDGPVLTWSPFEGRVLRSLGSSLVERLFDLQALMMRHYYHPGFGPAFSLKRVLGVLCPGEGYSDLEIREGGTATLFYQRMLEGEEALQKPLLAYCKRDTLALWHVHRALVERCEAKVH